MAVPTKYQDVVTATNYALTAEDGTPFKVFLSFNGTNQWLQTNSIDFRYGDKMFVCAGVRKLSDASAGVICELSADVNSNNGAFFIFGPRASGKPDYQAASRGTSNSTAWLEAYPSPITNIVGLIGSISSDQLTLRVNGTQAAFSAGDQGAGNYGNYPIYIGARAGSLAYFNGRLYQFVVAGKAASASEITNTETYLNQKTGAY